MRARDTSAGRPHDADLAGFPGVVPTDWGYVLVSGGAARRRALALAEALVAVAGVALVIAGISPWIAPGTRVDPDLFGHRAAVTVLFAMGGLVLLRYAKQGLQTEVHLDRLRGEVRIVARNRNDQTRLLDCIAFADITAVSVDRARPPSDRARLMLHADDAAARVALVSGPGDRLAALAAMLARDIERARNVAPVPDAGLGRLVPGIA